jgi:hypothetical protein
VHAHEDCSSGPSLGHVDVVVDVDVDFDVNLYVEVGATVDAAHRTILVSIATTASRSSMPWL